MNEATSEATSSQQRADAEAWELGLVGVGQFDSRSGLYDWYEGIPVGALIGRNVKRLREERVLTQHELAQLWQRRGLPWARSKLAALEGGKRPQVAIGEAIVMAAAMEVPLADLFRGIDQGKANLLPGGEGVNVQGDELLGFIRGAGQLPLEVGAEAYRMEREHMKRAAGREKPAQADVELAQRLGVHPQVVLEAAIDIFDGLTLTEERDRRVSRMGKLDAPERQAHRGHVTRELSLLVEDHLSRQEKP